MSRPLELTVYPPIPDEPYGDDREPWTWDASEEWKTARWVEERQAAQKHFMDPELCAEYWYAWNVFKTGNDGTQRDWKEYDRTLVLRRFATTPHAGEP